MSMRFSILAIFFAALAHGCDGCDNSGPIKDDTGPEVTVDGDGDGFTTDEDCNDADPTVHPGADEACDGVDNDCDGETDEGTDNTYYGDVDGDGFGDADTTIGACEPPSGYVENDQDCDDTDAEIHPDADEICNDLDDDCDGLIDDEDDSLVLESTPTWYVDDDGDGYGVDAATVQACEAPSGYVATDDDCDDGNATVFPGADEYCNGLDDDCDGDVDEDTLDAETRWYPDADGDGYGDPGEVLIQCTQPDGYVLDATDCNDADASTHPGATEYCDGTDNDCDGSVDEDDAVDGSTWYADTDGDGYGDASTATYACYQPTGYVLDDTDCDDTDAMQFPGAYEYCNGEDDDCDGTVDEDDSVDVVTWYADADGDGYGDAADSQIDCNEPTGHVLDDTDCDDTDAAQYPGADEYCNGEDDDCDGTVDEDNAVDVSTWYADRDTDGYGDAATSQLDCDQPTNFVLDDTDCDDTDAAQFPGADEYCNGEDDDCDGDVDEDDAIDVATWFEDSDSDAWGNDSVTDIDCDAPSGYIARGGDCDDTDPAFNPGASETDCTDPNDYNCDGSVAYADVDGDGYAACEECDDNDAAQYPGADEYCNGEDDDCDGLVDEDEALDVATWYADSDGDRYGDASITDIDCNQPSGYVANDTDCDDTDPAQFPGAVEYCNGEDDDCDGSVDEDSAFDVATWYRDDDGDTYGDAGVRDIDCDQPSGYVADDTDCDDSDAMQYPGATEYCNGEDDDCDGIVDEDDAADSSTWYIDGDADGYGNAAISQIDCYQPSGYVLDDTDCDDTDAAQYPGADEYCNGEDDDCDGTVDEDEAVDVATWYADSDSDGYGDAAVSDIDCDQPTDYVADDTDCDDTDAAQYPGADEFCNGEDDDCDGRVDEDDALDVLTWYADTDGDTYGDAADSDIDCDQPSGYVADDTDCDDTDAAQYPGADEYCNGEDDDCDGIVDEDEAVDVLTWYADADADTYGDAAVSQIDCDQPSGYVLDDTDCDDTDPAQYPGADEYCNGEDDDCDGLVDEDEAVDVLTWYADSDGDSYGDPAVADIDCYQPSGYVADDTDCDDGDDAQYPGATEYCNGEDDNCDGDIDEDSAADVLTWYADSDGDSYGDPAVADIDCDQPSAYVADDTDCDDGDAAQYPGATEYCNGEDDDCDGLIDEDEAADVLTWYADSDGDSYGDPAVSDIDCDQPSAYVADDTDCDDSDAAQYPGADEYCNGEDDDCDGIVDEDDAVDVSTWYADSDSDTYGDASISQIDCDQPTSYVLDDTDCDDDDASQYPGAVEYCNGEDDDCDGTVDEDGAADVLTWYADSDGDSYGDAAVSDIDCDQPTGYVADDTDCDDSDAAQYPGATEYCNGEDDDCDGTVDEDSAADATTWYVDSDGDSYGNAAVSDIECYQPTGYVADDTDCDDSDAAQYPGADEYCNGEDDDCDGVTDEDASVDVSTWYADSDADSYGDASTSQIDCDQPSGYVLDDTDCDDDDASQYPGAVEYCNGEDDDCDGTVDEDGAADVLTWYADSDGDTYGDPAVSDIDCDQPTGYVANNNDCDDGDAAQYPGADEYCNGEDDDCDGTVDEDDAVDVSVWYADSDGDSYGDLGSTDIDCYQPTGYVSDSSDCDDTDAAQYPGATEYCNGEDDDCDGVVDEDTAADVLTWYADSDGDTYGDPAVSDIDCNQPSAYVADNTDCDDTDAAVYPGAIEYCNGYDDDCDTDIDEDSAADVSTWYADSDVDGYGDPSSTDIDCYQPTGYVSDSSDCDDADAAQYPGADEYCNGEDDDCDGTVDEDDEVLDGDTYYADSDSDGTGDPASTIVACSVPSGYVDNAWDCDDTDSSEPVVVDAATGSSSGAGSMSSPLDTVQRGVDNAAQCVIVFAGTYNEAVHMNGTDLEVTGVEGADVTFIDASGLGDAAFSIDAGETVATVVEGFTLTGDGHYEVDITSYACTSIVTCYEYYYTHCGGGLYVSSADPTIRNVIAADSSLPYYAVVSAYPYTYYTNSMGGGMCFLDSAASVFSSEVWENYADQGGGVYADETSAISFEQGYLVANSASDGGGFEIDGGSLALSNVASSFNWNSGLLLIDATADVTNSTFAGEQLTGAALHASGSSILELNNSIVAHAPSAIGVYIESSAAYTGSYNDVYGNSGGNYSGITDPTGSSGNISSDPLFVAYSDDGVYSNDDLHLQSSSPCVNAGNPSGSYYDQDGTRNDMGAYGGPLSDWD